MLTAEHRENPHGFSGLLLGGRLGEGLVLGNLDRLAGRARLQRSCRRAVDE